MKKNVTLSVVFLLMLSAYSGHAQDALFSSRNTTKHLNLEYLETRPPKPDNHRIKDFVVFNSKSGIAYTSDSIFRTDDAGANWRTLFSAQTDEKIASVAFEGPNNGLVVLARTAKLQLTLARTSDGGASWTRNTVDLENASDFALDLESVSISRLGTGVLELTIRVPTSSNFTGRAIYRSHDAGGSWSYVSRSIEPSTDTGERSAALSKDGWTLETIGECSGFKSGCVQETRLFISGKESTPPQVKELVRRVKDTARGESTKEPMFALPPGGSTRISLNRGFDKCQAGSVAQMKLWWDNSYFFDSNIYFSGRNRACPSQPFTNNPAWIDQVSAMGWGLIPTVVGYQSPCTSSATTAKLSYDPAVSEQQGRGEADIAAADAASIGLTAGSILYYDMERYDPPTPDTLGCRVATVAFLKGWTDRVKELGYKSGTYGSPKNAQEDWVGIPAASRMDAIWMARWDNIPSVWTYLTFPNFPTDLWNNHQRIKQWQAPHNETWGGVTFNIDGNISDAPVAGIPVPKNKVADFDGDGKTDVSVFRPSTGEWYISGTLGPTFTFSAFGVATDILTPGDFDGDGKTDHAVYRPGESTWYLRMKGVYTARNFGEPGDVPAAADYNGDGKTDIAVFRPSNGTWYILFSDSQNSFGTVHFGQDGDRPAAADYDGDGKADIAVWRPSDGTWYVQGSAGNYFTAVWGVAGDVPAQADYDGDGKVDFAVFRTGMWYVLGTSSGMRVQNFGVEGDVPASGDFDGDGLYDIAVFRPSNGTWYLSQSQNGYAVREFGVANDKPIPAAYLPQ